MNVKQMKRMLAAVLCLLLVLPLAAPCGLAAEDPEEKPAVTVVSDETEVSVQASEEPSLDFEQDAVGEVPAGWTAGGTGTDPETSWVKVMEEEDGNHFLAVSATEYKKDAHATLTLPQSIEGEALVSLRVQFPDDAALNPDGLPNSAGVHLYKGTTTTPSVSIMNTSSELGHRPGTSSGSTIGLAKLELGRWYELEIRVDTAAQTYSLWLDGEELVTDATFRNSGSEAIGSIRVAAPSGYNGTICVDDLAIEPGAARKITGVTQPAPMEVPYGTAFEELGLPETVQVTLEDGQSAELAVDWSSESYLSGQEGEQTVTGTLRTGGAYLNDQALTASVQVTVQADAVVRDVLSVTEPEDVQVELGTTADQLSLPAQVEVTLTGDVTRNLSVEQWNCETYDPNEAGEYVFYGDLVLGASVTNTQQLRAEIHVWVGMDEFDMLRGKWYYQIAGNNDFDETDPDIAAYIDTLDTNANDIMEKLVPVSGTSYEDYYNAFMTAHMVFTDYPMTAQNKTGSSQRTLTYDRLKSLALAYRTKGCERFEDQQTRDLIVAAMDFMYDDNKYSTTSGSVGNWYDWEIGTPLRYLDLLVLMYDELDAEQIENFTASVDHYSPKADDMTGANRIWKCSVVAENSILRKDAEKLASVAPAVKKELGYVTSSDGFYEDGSYIQHTYYPYTGGYGKAFIVTMAPMVAVLAGTDYAIQYEDGAEKMFFNAVFDSYEPFLYNTGMMDMVRNREISRAGGQDHIAGRQVIRAIITLTDAMEGEQKARALSMVKYFLEQDDRGYIFKDDTGFFLEYYVALPHILMGKEILADNSIQPRGPLVGYYKFPSMDRVVQHTENYAFGLAMCGWNARTYEVVNEEGKNMWHTADGMLYLYNTDEEKYADNFWGTVDHQRLPGTTVDRYNKSSNFRSGATNGSDIVGGTDLFDLYGATAFEISNGAHSKKSYFFFDDEAVLLGSDISSTSGNPVETIVENYKANLDLSNTVSVDGKVQQLGEAPEQPDPVEYKTLMIASNTAGKNTSATRSFAEQSSGTLTLEYDAYFPDNANFLSVSLVSGDQLVTQLIVRDNTLAYRVSTSGSGQDGVSNQAALTAGQWHHVKLVVDLDAQQAHYYLDGKQITNATNHITGEPVDLTNAALLMADAKIDGILLGTPNGGTGTGYYDNLVLTAGEQVLLSEDFDSGVSGEAPDGWTRGGNDTAGKLEYAVLTVQPETPAREDEFTGVHEDINYIHMQGNVEGADVGYVFPGGADVTGLRETRTQKWTLMNTYEKFYYDEDVTNSFITIYLEHGTNPEGASYQYVILPGKSEEETAAYSASPDVEILANTETIHAVRETTLDITAANFFAAGSCPEAQVSADRPASVMFGPDDDGNLVVSVTDVTNKAEGAITITLDFPTGEVLTGDDTIRVEQTETSTVLTVDVTGSRGQSRIITFAGLEKPPVVTGVTVSPATASVQVGTTQQFTAVVEGENEPDQAVTWSVEGAQSETTSISDTGLLTVAEDETAETLTVIATSAEDPTVSGAAQVAVTAAPVKVSGVKLNVESVYLYSNFGPRGEQLIATVEPGDATDKGVTWTSADENVVTVNDLGYITVVGEGMTTVTVTTNDGGYTAECLVQVGSYNDGSDADDEDTTPPTETEEPGETTDPGEPTEPETPTFSDVPATHWASEAVEYVVSEGLFNGTSDTTFSPEMPMTRAMFFTVLARLDGVDTNGGATWYEKAMAWAVAEGITDGTNPEATITREQLAVMLYRYAGSPATEGSLSSFADAASVSAWAQEGMEWAVAEGILTGKNGSVLDPQGTASRAEVAMMLMRFTQNQE